MESAENQTELFEALLKWMASFRVAAGKMIREGFKQRDSDLINHPSSAHDTVEECSDGVAMAQVMTNLKVHVLCCCCHREINR